MNSAQATVSIADFATSSSRVAPATRLKAGNGWMTSARTFNGVLSLIASTSSPTISPARRDQCRADEHATQAVGHQLHRAPVEVVNVASCGLSRVGSGNDDVDAFRERGGLRQSD